MLARCVIGMQWIPENILRAVGTRAALLHVRDTVLRQGSRFQRATSSGGTTGFFADLSFPCSLLAPARANYGLGVTGVDPGVEPNNCYPYSSATRTALAVAEKGISMTVIDRLRYDGKRALVVGGATGMGAAAAKSAGELGAEVIVLDYAPVNYDVAKAIQVDLRDPASIDAALEQIEGPVHAVFSAAGVADGTRI